MRQARRSTALVQRSASARPVRAMVRALALLSLLLSVACSTLPESVERTPTGFLPAPDDSPLARDLATLTAAHPGLSGFMRLDTGEDAFAARTRMIAASTRSLDVQYYIWHDDLTGRVLQNRLLDAADRGVRVRLLLDDLDTAGKDHTLAILDSHPNLEVRLFNPFANRESRATDVVASGKRINHRMHNKSITADNLVTVFGGRNVGDEYFAASTEVGFGDMDVLAVGPIVSEVSAQFDLYWNSDMVYPLAALLTGEAPDAEAIDRFRRESQAYFVEALESRYAESLRQFRIAEARRFIDLPLTWSPWMLVYDQPDKIRQKELRADTHLAPNLLKAFDAAERDLMIVSPYFVPGDAFTDYLKQRVADGVRVRVLTNSLAANDVALVHAGYMRYRKDLIAGGVELFEYKARAERVAYYDAGNRPSSLQLIGASKSSLHAKLAVFDEQYLFVGSFNLDPRSVKLNTELGVYYRSPSEAGAFVSQFDALVDRFAYRVVLDRDGDLEWVTVDDGAELRLDHEPDTSWWQRVSTRLLSFIVPESQL